MARRNVKEVTPEQRAVGTHYQKDPTAEAKPSEVAAEAPAVPDGKAASEVQIAILAYEIWISRGRPHGSDQDDWFEAEKRLRTGANGRA
jgi:hypothetical protein